ncbi:MAG: hypothetical protein RR342_01230 [Bacilli bacterium]
MDEFIKDVEKKITSYAQQLQSEECSVAERDYISSKIEDLLKLRTLYKGIQKHNSKEPELEF